MKKTCCLLTLLVPLLAVTAAPLPPPTAAPAATAPTADPLTGVIRISDTTGGDPAVRENALRFVASHPKLEISIRKAKLADAMAELAKGDCDLVLATESALPADHQFRRRYACEAAILTVNAANPRQQFSRQELSTMFGGQLGDWSSINGSAYTLHLLSVPLGAPGETVFRRLVLKNAAYGAVFRKKDARELLLLTAANPNAMALTGYPSVEPGPQTKPVAVDGVPPTLENLRNGSYPLLDYRVAAFGNRLSLPAMRFLQSFSSPEFAEALRDHQLLPLL